MSIQYWLHRRAVNREKHKYLETWQLLFKNYKWQGRTSQLGYLVLQSLNFRPTLTGFSFFNSLPLLPLPKHTSMWAVTRNLSVSKAASSGKSPFCSDHKSALIHSDECNTARAAGCRTCSLFKTPFLLKAFISPLNSFGSLLFPSY